MPDEVFSDPKGSGPRTRWSISTLFTLLTLGIVCFTFGLSASGLPFPARASSTGPGASGADDEDEAASKGEQENHPVPVFQNEEGTQLFDDARAEFEQGEWKAAQKSFKKCQKHTDRDGKKILKAWINACKGGSKLGRLDKAVAKEDWRGAWRELSKMKRAYGTTPLSGRLDSYLDQIEPELFTILATFEDPPPKPEEKVSNRRPSTSSFNRDPRYILSGKRSLRWRESVGLQGNKLIGWLPLAQFEGGTLTEHRALHISIFSTDENYGKFTILVDGAEGNQPWQGMNPLKSNVFFHHLTVNKPGWSHYQIDLVKGLSTHSSPQLQEMTNISLLIIPPSKPKVIYIDDVKLEKR